MEPVIHKYLVNDQIYYTFHLVEKKLMHCNWLIPVDVSFCHILSNVYATV